MKKLLIYALILTAGVFGTGCTAGEIGAGAIGVAIGIGIGRHHGHHHGDHHRHPPRHRHGHWNQDAVMMTSRNADISDLSSRYQIPMTSAAKIVDAFDNAEALGLDSFKTIGIQQSDMKSFMKRQLPPEQSIQNFAAKLSLSESKGRNVLSSMMREFSSQAANVRSEYWEYCMSEGSWKTDRNRSCSNARVQGCSPATGAQFCY